MLLIENKPPILGQEPQSLNKASWIAPQVERISLLETAGGGVNAPESDSGYLVMDS